MTSYSYSDIIGRGATATIRLAWPRWHPFRVVAVKCVDPAYANDLTGASRVDREQSLRLVHPHLATPIDTHEHGGQVRIVMPLARFGSLEDAIGARALPSDAACAKVLVDVLEGLAALHDAGVLHRDLKPANVLLSERRGRVTAMVADFGTSRQAGAPPLSTVGAPVGTLGFIAPEVLAGGEYTARSDLWSVGAIAARMAASFADSTPMLDSLAAALTAAEVSERPSDARAAIGTVSATDLPAHVDAASFGAATGRRSEYRPPARVAWRRHHRRLIASCSAVGLAVGVVPVGAALTVWDEPTPAVASSSSSTEVSGVPSRRELIADSPCRAAGTAAEVVTARGNPIRIGVPNDRSSPARPGFNEELWQVASAFSAWCNESGGIQGRKIELVDLDARLGTSPVDAGCDDVDATVGGGWMNAPDLDESCSSVNVPAFPSRPGSRAPSDTADERTAFGPPRHLLPSWLTDLAQLFPGAMQRPVIVSSGGMPAMVDAAVQALDELNGRPAEVTADPDDDLSVADLNTTLARLAATSIWFIGEPSWIANIRRRIVSPPEVHFAESFAFGDRSARDGNELDGLDGLDGLVAVSTLHPPSEADRWPGVTKMRAVLREFGGTTTDGPLSTMAWSAWMLFAETATRCDATNRPSLRACLTDTKELADLGWTGRGVHAPVRDAQTGWVTCANILQLTNGRWLRLSPRLDATDTRSDPPADATDATADAAGESTGFTCHDS